MQSIITQSDSVRTILGVSPPKYTLWIFFAFTAIKGVSVCLTKLRFVQNGLPLFHIQPCKTNALCLRCPCPPVGTRTFADGSNWKVKVTTWSLAVRHVSVSPSCSSLQTSCGTWPSHGISLSCLTFWAFVRASKCRPLDSLTWQLASSISSWSSCLQLDSSTLALQMTLILCCLLSQRAAKFLLTKPSPCDKWNLPVPYEVCYCLSQVCKLSVAPS